MKVFLRADTSFDSNFSYIQGILFKIILNIKNKNKIIENMFSMRAEKSSSGQMLWILGKNE